MKRKTFGAHLLEKQSLTSNRVVVRHRVADKHTNYALILLSVPNTLMIFTSSPYHQGTKHRIQEHIGRRNVNKHARYMKKTEPRRNLFAHQKCRVTQKLIVSKCVCNYMYNVSCLLSNRPTELHNLEIKHTDPLDYRNSLFNDFPDEP